MIAKIQELLEEVEKLKASNLEEVEALRIKYLSKKGSLNALMADFRNVPAEMKKEVGMKLNDLKAKAQEKIAALKEAPFPDLPQTIPGKMPVYRSYPWNQADAGNPLHSPDRTDPCKTPAATERRVYRLS